MINIRFSYTPTRRAMLRALVGGIALAAWPFTLYASSQQRALEQPLMTGAMESREALTLEQAATIQYLVELIIPSDTTPGARETGSADFVLASLVNQGAEAIAVVAQAIAAIDGLTMQVYGQPFRALPSEAAHQVAATLSIHPQLMVFWHSVRSLAVLHFYAHPQAYRPLGLPGPSIDLGGFPGGVSVGGAVSCPSA